MIYYKLLGVAPKILGDVNNCNRHNTVSSLGGFAYIYEIHSLLYRILKLNCKYVASVDQYDNADFWSFSTIP